jgi:hypothetical protein
MGAMQTHEVSDGGTARPATEREENVSLLNLASFREERIEEADHQLSILVSTKSVPDGCCLLPALVRNGTKRIMFRDQRDSPITARGWRALQPQEKKLAHLRG